MFDLDLLDDADPFEVDSQTAHLFKHPHLGLADVRDVWANTPVFYPAKPPAHWLMVAEVHGCVLVVPLAPSRGGDPRRVGRSVATRLPSILPDATRRTDD